MRSNYRELFVELDRMSPASLVLITVLLLGMADAAVKVKCPRDFDVIADRGSASAVVTWSKDDFRIHSVSQIRALFQTVPEYGANASLSRSFSEGAHWIQYRALDNTGRISHCSFNINVRVVRCPVLHRPRHGSVRCDSGNYYGSMCTVDCQTGYTPVGNQPIECTLEAVWSDDLPHCIATTCPDPGHPIHASRHCSSAVHIHGSRCSFACRRGYRLLGNPRLACVVNEAGLTTWSDATPSCQEIIPPSIESCPIGPVVHVTASRSDNKSGSEVTAEVPKPDVVFRLSGSTGPVTPHRCTHFLDDRSARFSIGRHVVTCTAYDDEWAELTPLTQCQFVLEVQEDRCAPLKPPARGRLQCSAITSFDNEDDVIECELLCGRRQWLPSDNKFECNRRTGTWLPSNEVPSCIVPIRPTELALPAELLYVVPFDCSAVSDYDERSTLLRLIGTHFTVAVKSLIRDTNICSGSQAPCHVQMVNIICHAPSGATDHEILADTSSSSNTMRTANRRRRLSRRTKAVFESSASSRRRSVPQSSHRKVRRRTFSDAPTTIMTSGTSDSTVSLIIMTSGTSDSTVSFQFNLITRFSSEGRWLDEYNKAAGRLLAVYDELDDRLMGAKFRLESLASVGGDVSRWLVREVSDSLTKASAMKTRCAANYCFDVATKLCVPHDSETCDDWSRAEMS